MPAKPPPSLFHPKKTARPPPPPSTPRKARPPPKEEDDPDQQLPTGPYQDFKLLSSALNGWKYDVMKFDARKTVDISTWQAPIKLNRKDLRRDDPSLSGTQALTPMLGLDGKLVFGADGKPVMAGPDGRPVVDGGHIDAAAKAKAAANAKKKFQKKTRQVFIVPEETRQLRREERYPWVIEDASGAETWLGQLEDLEKSQTHAFFMPAANDVFKFVPAHRWYKFQKKVKHDMPTDTVAVESAYTKSQKRDPQLWLHQRNGKGPSAATAAMFKAESEGRSLSGSSSLVHDSGQSLGPGGRKLKTVDSGMTNLFGDDDDDQGAQRRREREYGEEGDLDENVYEEDFADDEEKMNVDDNVDEEAKELEERLKKEYKSANKTREAYIDDSDEDDTPGKTKQEKAMQKLIRNREGNDAYDSDEEKNPYATSEEEDEEEEILPPPPVPVEAPAQPAAIETESIKPIPSRPQTNGSRAASPVSPSMGGHSVVAKRATSPKAPKQKPNNATRGTSPLAGRSSSPASGSRATSPVANNGSRAGSPVNGVQKKRKATDETGTNAAPKLKKRKTPTNLPTGQLDRTMLIEWLKATPNASTRDCIAHFTPYLQGEDLKRQFTAMVKELAHLKDGSLQLKKEYRDPSAPASPAV
ncbi:transcription initiation factor [Mycena floridula]|nr:transcription initiation factor [Mycena floridula]